ncbi:MAG: hypothetical protein LBC53_06265 [Spirochaetaceae bacterium]|jgi:hypothetical protein|nr:hypothetical protein [Spirochaetaceae bacterium]
MIFYKNRLDYAPPHAATGTEAAQPPIQLSVDFIYQNITAVKSGILRFYAVNQTKT